MSFTIGNKRYFFNQPAFLLVFWLAIPFILLIYLPPIWEWVAVGISALIGFAITFRVEDALVEAALSKSIQEGNPMFRAFSGKEILAFSTESLAIFDAKPSALNAWAQGWEGWQALKEKHAGDFFYWNSLLEVQGGSPIAPIEFHFQEAKKLAWRPASMADRSLILNAIMKYSASPLTREDKKVSGNYLQAAHILLLPLVLGSIMVTLIGFGMISAIDANNLSHENAERGPIFWFFWEMIDQILKIVPQRFLTEIGIVGFCITLWAGFVLSVRKHTESHFKLKAETEPELVLPNEKVL